MHWKGSLSDLFPSEPLERVGFLSVTKELEWGGFSHGILISVVPCFSRGVVDFPASIRFFSGGPVGNFESLEHGSWSSVERNVFHSFEQRGGVEVLSVDMLELHGLLMEFLVVETVDCDTYFSSFLYMESISNIGDVRVHESHKLTNTLLDRTSWVENHLNPSKNRLKQNLTYPSLPLGLILYLRGLPIYLLPMKAPDTILSSIPFPRLTIISVLLIK